MRLCGDSLSFPLSLSPSHAHTHRIWRETVVQQRSFPKWQSKIINPNKMFAVITKFTFHAEFSLKGNYSELWQPRIYLVLIRRLLGEPCLWRISHGIFYTFYLLYCFFFFNLKQFIRHLLIQCRKACKNINITSNPIAKMTLFVQLKGVSMPWKDVGTFKVHYKTLKTPFLRASKAVG